MRAAPHAVTHSKKDVKEHMNKHDRRTGEGTIAAAAAAAAEAAAAAAAAEACQTGLSDWTHTTSFDAALNVCCARAIARIGSARAG